MSTSVSMQDRLNELRGRPEDLNAWMALQRCVEAQEGLSGEDRTLLERAREELRQAGEWQAVVGLIDVELRHVSEAERVTLLTQKGRVLKNELLQQEQALEVFKELVELRPDDDDLLDTLEQIELTQENWERIAAKYLDEAEGATDRALAAGLLLSAAEIVWRNSDELGRVEQLLARCLEVEPDNRRARVHLMRLLRQSGRRGEAVSHVEHLVDSAESPAERIAALFGAARLFDGNEGGTAESVHAARYLTRVLEIDPRNALAQRRLVELEAGPGAWAELAGALGAVLGGSGSDGDLDGLIALARVLTEKVGAPAQAEPLYRRIRMVDSTHPTMVQFYRDHYKGPQAAAKLLAVLDQAARNEREIERRTALSIEMATLAEEQLENLDKAIEIWKGILRAQPAMPEASAALKRLYRSATPPKWNALRELLKEEIDALDPEAVAEKVVLLHEVVEIYSEHLKLDVMVINTYGAILELAPDDPDALAALMGRYETMGRWNDLIGLLVRRKDAVASPPEKIALLRRIAEIWTERFGNPTQAIEPLSEILSIDPLDDVALVQLKEIHRRRRNWHGLLALLRAESASRSVPQRRVLIREMAEIAATRLGDAGEAIEVWNQLLGDDPSDAEALAALSELYRRQERWESLAEVLHRMVAAGGEVEAVLALLEQLGDIFTNRLRDPANAIDAWRAVLRLRPEHPKAVNLLRELYVQQGRWPELESLFAERGGWSALAEALTTAADRAFDDVLRVQLYRRVGELCAEQLQSPERAIKAYERALAVDDQDAAVCSALVPLYQATERWSRLLGVYETLLAAADNDADKLDLLGKIRDICVEQLGSKQLAFQAWVRAYQLAPDRSEIRQELLRLAEHAEAWDELVPLLSQRLAAVSEIDEQQALLRELASICVERLHRPEDAEGYHNQLVSLDPGDVAALEALESLYSSRQRWSDLVEIYRAQVELAAQGSPRRLERLYRIAFVREERAGDPAAAISTYREILAEAAEELRALRALERLHMVRGDWGELVAVYRLLLAQTIEEAERVEILHKLGELLYDELDDREGAVAALAEALRADPNHRPTVIALEHHLAIAGSDKANVARLLEPLYERSGDFSKLAGVVEVLTAAEKDPQAQRTMLGRLQGLYERRTQQPERALEVVERLLALDPRDEGARRDLARLAGELAQHERLVKALEAALQAIGPDDPLALTLRWEAATALDEGLGDSEAAELHVRRVLAANPRHRAALALLERMLRDRGSWEELRDILHRRLDLAPSVDEERAFWQQICALNDDVLGDAPAAVEAYEQLLLLKPSDEAAAAALERHYRDAEMWVELADFYGGRVRFAADDEEIDALKVRQAEVRARELGDPAGALDLLDEVVASDPDQAEALSMLEFMLTEDDERRRVTETLEAIYQRSERWDDVANVLLIRRNLSEDAFEKVELLARVAHIHEHEQQDPQAAFFRYREALRLSPGSSDVRGALKRLASELDLWEAAAEAWQAALEVADPADLPLRGALLLELARVQDEQLADYDAAIRSYEALYDCDPDLPEWSSVALGSLARLYERAANWLQLVATLRRQLERSASDGERAAIIERIGATEEDRLDDVAAATSSYRALLDLDPGSIVALDALERLYIAGGHYEELVGVIKRRIDLSAEAELRATGWRRVAELYESALQQRDEAVLAYLALLDVAPDDPETLRALTRLYAEGERWSDQLDILERRLGLLAPHSAEFVDLTFDAATTLHRRLGEVPAAVDRYREILTTEPRHLGAREALAALAEDASYGPLCWDILLPHYRDEGLWSEVIGLLRAKLGQLEGIEAFELLREIGEIYEERLADQQRAFDAIGGALALEVAHPQLADLVNMMARLAVALGAWEALVAALERAVDWIADADLRRDMHRLIAETCRQELGDVERTEAHYRQLRELDPSDLQPLEVLELLYLQHERWSELLEVLKRRAELVEDRQQRVDILSRAALVLRDELGRPGEAVELFEQVQELDPDNLAATDALDGLYAQTDRWEQLAALLERRAQLETDPERQAGLYYRLAAVRAERLTDPSGALVAYQELLALRPNDAEAIGAIERYLDADDVALALDAAKLLEPLYVGRQQWQELIRLQEVRLAHVDDPRQRTGLMTRVAQLYEEQLEDYAQAFEWYGRIFLDNPSERSARDQLVRLAGMTEGWAALAEIFERYLAEALEVDPIARDVALLTVTIYDDRLYTWQPAKAVLDRVLTADPSDEEAFRILEQLLMRHEQWHQLLALYEQMSGASLDPRRRLEFLSKRARVWEEALEDLPQAIDAYRAILDESREPEVVEALNRLYPIAGRWEELCELIVGEFEGVDEVSERVALKLRLGGIYEEQLHRIPAAIDEYEEILGHDPDHMGAIRALERLVMVREQRPRIATILEDVYRRQDEWAKLVVIYDAQLAFVDDVERRIFLLGEIARLHEERGGSLELAFDALCQALELAPAAEGLHENVERIGGQLGVWPRVVQVLSTCSEASYDPEVQATLMVRVAELVEQMVGELPDAVEAWRKVQALHPGDPGARAALIRLLETLERWEELVDELRAAAEASVDGDEQRNAYWRMAEIQREQLGDDERAIEACRRIVELRPGDSAALSALAETFERLERWSDLIWVYREQVEAAEDDAERRELQLKMAQTFELRMGDCFEAIAVYRGLLSQDHQDGLVLDALDRLYTTEALWVELLEILDLKIEAQAAQSEGALGSATGSIEDETKAADGTLALLELKFRAGAVLSTELEEHERAIDRLEEVLVFDPAHLGARGVLEALIDDEAQRPRVATVLEPVYQALEQHQRLVDMLEVQLEQIADGFDRCRLLMRIAGLREDALVDERGAFETLERALVANPADEGVYAPLERLGASLGEYARLAASYAAQAEASYDDPLRRELSLKAAAIAEEQLGDDRLAERHYRTALETEGDRGAVLVALDRVLSRLGDDARLVEIVEQQIAIGAEPQRLAELYFRCGGVRQRLGDVEGSFGAFRESLQQQAGHEGGQLAMLAFVDNEIFQLAALDILEPIREEAGEVAALLPLLEVRLTTLGDPLERGQLLGRMARLASEELGEAQAAFGYWLRALQEDPLSEEAIRQAEALAAGLGLVDQLAAAASEVMGRAVVSAEAKRSVGLRLARWQAEGLGDEAAALATYGQILEVDPEAVAAWEALDEIYRRQGEWDALAEVLAARADLAQDRAERKRLWIELAALQDEREELSAAVEAYERALELDEDDLEVLDSLASAFERAGRWRDLVEVLGRRGAWIVDGGELLALKGRVATVLAERLEDLDGAADVYREMLDLDATDTRALVALEQLYRDRGDYVAVEEMLLRRQDAVGEDEALNILRELAKLNVEALANPSAAIAYLQRALELAPEDETLFGELGALLRSGAQWYDLIELMRKRAAALTAGERHEAALALLVSIARLWIDELENAEAAAEVLEEVIERDEGNAVALAELARLYEVTEQWERCEAIVERAAELAAAPEAAADLACRRGRVLAHRGAEVNAILAAYEQALTLSPGHRDAARSIAQLARESGQWARVAEMLELEASDLSDDSEQQLTRLLELARLYRERLADSAQELATLERARQLAPEDKNVLVPLVEAYVAAGQVAAAEPLLATLVAQAGGRRSRELARYHQIQGQLAQARGDLAGACEALDKAYRMDSTSGPILKALGQAYMEAEDWQGARRIYRAMLLQNAREDWDISRAEICGQLGRVHRALGESDKARGMFERGLELDPENTTLRAELEALG